MAESHTSSLSSILLAGRKSSPVLSPKQSLAVKALFIDTSGNNWWAGVYRRLKQETLLIMIATRYKGERNQHLNLHMVPKNYAITFCTGLKDIKYFCRRWSLCCIHYPSIVHYSIFLGTLWTSHSQNHNVESQDIKTVYRSVISYS